MFSSRIERSRETLPRQTSRSGKSSQKMKKFNYFPRKVTPIPNLQQLLSMGKQYYKDSQLHRAVSCFEEALKCHPTHVQINYMLGVCLLSLEKYQQASTCLELVTQQAPNFRRNLFMLLSISFKKQNQFDKALSAISEAIKRQPDYIDAYVYRAKLHMKMKRYDEATKDFEQAAQLEPNNLTIKMLLSDCFKFDGKNLQALKAYTSYLQIQPNNPNIRLKRAVTLYELNEFENSMKDLSWLISKKYGGSDALYFQAMIFLKENKQSQALLAFQKAITENSSQRAVSRSIQELAVMKIRSRDFYEAYEVLKRARFLQRQENLSKLYKFVEAAIFLMKRKFQEAQELFKESQGDWLEPPRKNHEFLQPLFHAYRAYGLFCTGNHKQALREYKLIEKPDESCSYNMKICQGIVSQSIEIFESILDQKHMEPYFYSGVLLIQKSIKEESSDGILRAVQLLTQGLHIVQLSNLYYYRALVYLFLSMTSEALDDIDKAIQKSQDNVPKYFYLRGLIFAMEGNFKQAITQLTTCISLDRSIQQAYIQRAKCYMLEGDLLPAYNDLEITNNNYWLAVFFIHNSQYNEAEKMLENVEADELTEMVSVRLGRWEKASVTGKLFQAVLRKDMQVLRLINGALSSNIPVGHFQPEDTLILKALLDNNPIDSYQKAMKMLSESRDEGIVEEEYNLIKLTQLRCNIAFTLFEQGKLQEGIQILENVQQNTPYDELKNKIDDFFKKIKQGKNYRVNFFNQTEMMTQFLSERQIVIGDCIITYKPYISFPLIPLPSIASQFDTEWLRKFTLSDVQNRPDAPWIRRNPQGVIFTDNVQVFQYLKLETSVAEEEPQEESSMDHMDKIQKLKEELKLDSRIEQKLNRLNNKT